MKKFLVVLIVFLMVMALAVPAFAAGHSHGPHQPGKGFGEAVSFSAQNRPLALANHVSGGRIPWCF